MKLEHVKQYESSFLSFLNAEGHADAAHDVNHILRVVKVATQLTIEEQAKFAVVIPAAWLHDCVSLPKNHPNRTQASKLAGDKAVSFLSSIDYPSVYLDDIHHAITAHSFSANVPPCTLEAKIVQDADRLDALGAVGVARCMQVSGALNRPLYSSDDPFCETRPLNDAQYTIDHFYNKLFNIADTLNTPSAQLEGKKREVFMRVFLAQLRDEI